MSANQDSGKKLTEKTLDKILEVYAENTFQENSFFANGVESAKRYAKGYLRRWGVVKFHSGAYRLFIFKGKKGIKEARRWSGEEVCEYWMGTEKDYIVQMKYAEVNPSFTDTINAHKEFIQNVLDHFKEEGINYFPLR